MPNADNNLRSLTEELKESNKHNKVDSDVQKDNSSLLKGILGEVSKTSDALTKNTLLEEEKRREAIASERNKKVAAPKSTNSEVGSPYGGAGSGLLGLLATLAPALGIVGGKLVGSIKSGIVKVGAGILAALGLKKLLKSKHLAKVLPYMKSPLTWGLGIAAGLGFYFMDDIQSFFSADGPPGSETYVEWDRVLAAGVASFALVKLGFGLGPAFLGAGKALLTKFGVNTKGVKSKYLKNPRMWGFALAMGVALSFSSTASEWWNDLTEPSEGEGSTAMDAALNIAGVGLLFAPKGTVAAIGGFLKRAGIAILTRLVGASALTAALGTAGGAAAILSGPVGWGLLAAIAIGWTFREEIGDYLSEIYAGTGAEGLFDSAVRSLFGNDELYNTNELEGIYKKSITEQKAAQDQLATEIDAKRKLYDAAVLKLSNANLAPRSVKALQNRISELSLDLDNLGANRDSVQLAIDKNLNESTSLGQKGILSRIKEEREKAEQLRKNIRESYNNINAIDSMLLGDNVNSLQKEAWDANIESIQNTIVKYIDQLNDSLERQGLLESEYTGSLKGIGVDGLPVPSVISVPEDSPTNGRSKTGPNGQQVFQGGAVYNNTTTTNVVATANPDTSMMDYHFYMTMNKAASIG